MEYEHAQQSWDSLISTCHRLREEISQKKKKNKILQLKVTELNIYNRILQSKNNDWKLFFKKYTEDMRKPFHQELIAQEYDLRQENKQLKEQLEKLNLPNLKYKFYYHT